MLTEIRNENSEGFLHPDIRLNKLDRELMIERSKSVDVLRAVRDDEELGLFQIPVTVMRVRSDYFGAVCSVEGKVHRRYAAEPSTAVRQIVRTIQRKVNRMAFEANVSKNLELIMTQ